MHRHFHTLFWTGSRMPVWGGMVGTLDDETYLATGGLYDPATGVWTPTNLAGAPSGRIWHAGVWTGTSLIVWGGYTDAYGSYTSTGGVYTPRGNPLFKDGFESSDMSAWNPERL